MNQRSFLNGKSFILILLMSITIAIEVKSMDMEQRLWTSAGGGAAVGAFIAGPPGAVVGYLAGTGFGILHEDINSSNERLKGEALEKIRKKQAELKLHIESAAVGQITYWAHPSENSQYSLSENLNRNWYKRAQDQLAIQTIIDKLKSNEFGPYLLNLLQECAVLSTLPGADPEAFRNLARRTIACYMQGALTPHRLALEDRLPKSGDITLEQYKRWFEEKSTENQNAQRELLAKANAIRVLREEKEKVAADLAQSNRQKQRLEADLAREHEQHQKALQELEAARKKEQEVFGIIGEIEELEENHKEVMAENANLLAEVTQRRAASPARRAELESKNARIAELEAALQEGRQNHRNSSERPASHELPVIHMPAPEPTEKPLFQKIQSWFEEKLK